MDIFFYLGNIFFGYKMYRVVDYLKNGLCCYQMCGIYKDLQLVILILELFKVRDIKVKGF